MENTLLGRRREAIRGWQEEEDKLLTELWHDHDLPASTIGERLSRSKNSVVGRSHRLGLPRRKVSPKVGRPRRKRQMDSRPIIVSPPVAPEPPGPFKPIGIPLMEAEAHHCRAIVGKDKQGLALFCGHPSPLGHTLSFCVHHLKEYTHPSRQRIR